MGVPEVTGALSVPYATGRMGDTVAEIGPAVTPVGEELTEIGMTGDAIGE